MPASLARRSTASAKLEVLDVAQEPDRVAALAAAEAVVQACLEGETQNDGVFSVWNGHSPTTRSCPAFFSVR